MQAHEAYFNPCGDVKRVNNKRLRRYVTRDPFLTALEYQFADPSDYPRRANHLCWLKRQVCRGFALRGLDRTAAELSQFLGIPKRTVERTIRLLREQGFLSNVRTILRRDKTGRRTFLKERVLHKLNPQALLPVNVAVTQVQSGGDNSPKNKTTQEISSDSPCAEKVAHGPAPLNQNASSEVKTNERHFAAKDLLILFARHFSYDIFEADGRLGWILKRAQSRKAYRNPLGPRIRDEWKYVVAANRNLDEQHMLEPGSVGPFVEQYSFSEMNGIPLGLASARRLTSFAQASEIPKPLPLA